MKKTASICLILGLLACLFGCGDAQDGTLTLAIVRSLAAEKGEDLTWSDFAQYPGTETGSGLYILVYETDAAYRVMIGGTPEAPPMYLYLVSTEDFDRRIDIRYDDIDTFLNQAG